MTSRETLKIAREAFEDALKNRELAEEALSHATAWQRLALEKHAAEARRQFRVAEAHYVHVVYQSLSVEHKSETARLEYEERLRKAEEEAHVAAMQSEGCPND